MRVVLAFGWVLYLIGAAGAGWILARNAVADTSLARIEGPAAPALELGPGGYALEAAEGVRVFALATREPLALSADGAGARFEVPAHGIYIVELLSPGGRTAVQQRRALSISSAAVVAAAVAPLATVPGLLLLAGRNASGAVRVTLGAVPFNVASLRRRIAGVVLDLASIGAMMVLLLLSGPLFPPLTPLFPLAPLIYAWSGNARGRTLGKWLTGTRVVGADGRPLGAVDGLIRTLGGGLAWGVFGAGYALATLDHSRRAPHDRLARSYVVYD